MIKSKLLRIVGLLLASMRVPVDGHGPRSTRIGKRKISFLLLALIFCHFTTQAQEAMLASGGNASGSGGLVNYSVGQVVYTTNTGISGSVAQGVLQAYEISVVSGIGQISLQSKVYPNPTTDLLNLKVENYADFGNEGLSYQLINLNGIILENKKLHGNEMSISMENLSPAIYFLKVTGKQKVLKTFRIIKK
jgi:hypothetical protein